MPSTAPTVTRPVLSERLREALGFGALVALTLSAVLFAVLSAGGQSFVVPASRKGLPLWMAGPLHLVHTVMTADQSVLVLGFMTLCWVALLAFGVSLRLRWVVAAIVFLHFIFMIAPPLLSKDIFSYISYSRLAVLHGVDPYKAIAANYPGDPAYPYLGWTHTGSAYGPLFTVGSYPIALVGVAAATWIIKVVTAFASLGLVWLTWRTAQRLGRSGLDAIVWVGLNPLLLVYGVGGAHNDIIMLAFAMGGVLLTLNRRENEAAFSVVASIAVKASTVVMIPFMLLRSGQPLRTLRGFVIAGAVMLALSIAAFGSHALGVLSVLKTQQHLVSDDSVPAMLGKFFHLGGVTSDVRLVARLLTLLALAGLCWLVWKQMMDWVSASGWALVTLALTSSWMLGWYVLWPLPFAAVSKDRRLRVAVLALTVYFVVMRWPTFIK